MALFEPENFETPWWMEIAEELAWIGAPDTTELPKSDLDRKKNIEKFRKFGFVIDQNIEDSFITMKTERFSYKSKWVTKKFSRLVPIFDISKANWKTIEELNAKIYWDNVEKLLTKKRKWWYVWISENWKVTYKSRKELNFSSKNLVTGTNSVLKSQSSDISQTENTAWVFSHWENIDFGKQILGEQNMGQKIIVPYRPTWAETVHTTQTLWETIVSPTTEPEKIQIEEVHKLPESAEILSWLIDFSKIDPSDYQLLEKVLWSIRNISNEHAKIIEINKPSWIHKLTNKVAYGIWEYKDMSIIPTTEFNTDMDWNGKSDRQMHFSLSNWKFVIEFSKKPEVKKTPEWGPQPQQIESKENKENKEGNIKSTVIEQQPAQVSAPIIKTLWKTVSISNNKNTWPLWAPIIIWNDVSKRDKIIDSWKLYQLLRRNKEAVKSMNTIDWILANEKFSTKDKTWLTDKITSHKAQWLNMVQQNRIVREEIAKNRGISISKILESDSLKVITLSAMSIKSLNALDAQETGENLIDYINKFMQTND